MRKGFVFTYMLLVHDDRLSSVPRVFGIPCTWTVSFRAGCIHRVCRLNQYFRCFVVVYCQVEVMGALCRCAVVWLSDSCTFSFVCTSDTRTALQKYPSGSEMLPASSRHGIMIPPPYCTSPAVCAAYGECKYDKRYMGWELCSLRKSFPQWSDDWQLLLFICVDVITRNWLFCLCNLTTIMQNNWFFELNENPVLKHGYIYLRQGSDKK